MPSCNTYHLTSVSLILDVGVSLHGCSSKAELLLLTLDEGYLLIATVPDLQRGIALQALLRQDPLWIALFLMLSCHVCICSTAFGISLLLRTRFNLVLFILGAFDP